MIGAIVAAAGTERRPAEAGAGTPNGVSGGLQGAPEASRGPAAEGESGRGEGGAGHRRAVRASGAPRSAPGTRPGERPDERQDRAAAPSASRSSISSSNTRAANASHSPLARLLSLSGIETRIFMSVPACSVW